MVERVSSDHPAVTTHRARVRRRGGTRRLELCLPADADVPVGEVVRLSIDGRQRHAPLARSDDGSPVVRGAYDNARRARERDGTDRLAEWLRAADADPGRSVLFDVVVPGSLYGLRLPGTTTVYEAADPPADSLRRIASRLEDDR